MSSSPALAFSLPESVVVTGAASGLGEAVALLLCECGVRTLGVDAAPAGHELSGREHYLHVAGDVVSEETWADVGSRIDFMRPASLGLVTAAAVLDVGTVLAADAAAYARAFAVNVAGVGLAMKALIPRMIGLGGGPIVAVGSVSGSFGEQQLAIYTATKGAVRQLARTAAMDHARQGIRINVLSPGPMMVGLFKRHLESAADRDRFLATRANRQPNGRILEAREVGEAVLFLLSSGAAAIIGADIMADGGLTASFDFRTGTEGASV